MYIFNTKNPRKRARNKTNRVKAKRQAKLRRRFNRTKGRKLGRRAAVSVRS
jgi:hypothetical protein